MTVNKWISVKNELPPPGVPVLGMNVSRFGNNIFSATFCCHTGWHSGDKGLFVEYWMPEPPFDEEDYE